MNACAIGGWRIGSLVLLIAAQMSCGASDVDRLARSGPVETPSEPVPRALSFEPSSTLTLTTSQSTLLRVVATPPDRYRVRFALLPDDDRANDASLDKTEEQTDEAGVAIVELRAPSSATTFRIRASVGTAVSSLLAVSISDSGFGTLRVEPLYNGKRTVTEWVASVRAGTTCAAMTGNPPADGDLVAAAPLGSTPDIEHVPIGPALAVTARAGFFAGGCVDMPGLTQSAVEHVSVPILDRPVQLTETDLQVSLGIAEPTAEWNQALDFAIESSVGAMLGEAADDVSALLDDMERAADAGSEDFAAARLQADWQTKLQGLFGYDAPSAIRTKAALWMVAGANKLVQPDTFVGRLGSANPDTEKAHFELYRVAQLNATTAGFPATILADWSAEPGDRVLLGIPLHWSPSRLVVALANVAAAAEFEGSQNGGEALAQFVGCDRVADALTDPTSGEAYVSCDKTCVVTLCEQALSAMWDRAREALYESPATLQVSATGEATVDNQARPVSFQGTWIGTLQETSSGSASVGGPLRGAPPPPPP